MDARDVPARPGISGLSETIREQHRRTVLEHPDFVFSNGGTGEVYSATPMDGS